MDRVTCTTLNGLRDSKTRPDARAPLASSNPVSRRGLTEEPYRRPMHKIIALLALHDKSNGVAIL